MTSITSDIVIPKNVATIGNAAFYNTSSAPKITFATDSVISSVKYDSFTGSKYMVDASASDDYIADTNNKCVLGHGIKWSKKTLKLTSNFCCIADSAFKKINSSDPIDSNLRKVSVNNGNLYVGANAFEDVTTLENFVLLASSDNVTYGTDAFLNAGHKAASSVATSTQGAETIFAGPVAATSSSNTKTAAGSWKYYKTQALSGSKTE